MYQQALRRAQALPFRWDKPGGSLRRAYPLPATRPRRAPQETLIRHRTLATDRLGEQPLWEGYGQGRTATRTPKMVRTQPLKGRLYADMVRKLRPDVVVEFGAAFGVSGMYWLAGLEQRRRGHLFSFEVNPVWAGIAKDNLAAVGDRFTLTVGAFEDNVAAALGDRRLDLAMIDAVHTSEWVIPQFELVANHANHGATVVCDDIDLNEDMRSCWRRLVDHRKVAAAVQVTRRVGLLQLR